MHGHDYRSLPAEMTLYKYPVRKYMVPLTVLCIVLNFDIVLKMRGPIVVACSHNLYPVVLNIPCKQISLH